jgi:hypothetical protein
VCAASGSRSYTYDRDGNRLTKTEGGTTYSSVYDRTDELVSVTLAGGASQTYTYDGRQAHDDQRERDSQRHELHLRRPRPDPDARDRRDGLADLDRYLELRRHRRDRRPDQQQRRAHEHRQHRQLAWRSLWGQNRSHAQLVVPGLHGSIAASLDAREVSITNAIRYDAWAQTIATGAHTSSPAAVGDKPWRFQGRLDISPTRWAPRSTT